MEPEAATILETEPTFGRTSTFRDDIIEVQPTLNQRIISDDEIRAESTATHQHTIVERSAAPILRDLEKKSRTFDNILSQNKLEDIDDVEIHQNRYYKHIQPTKTHNQPTILANKQITPSIMTQEQSLEGSGEARGVPRGRAISPKGPRSMQSATTQTSATSLRYDSMGRQANPDIQDIITGLVKLLNGNVNVQANTQPANGRPLRPQSNRINNRGPPRISDVPPLPPDFDTPGPVGPAQMLPPLPPQPSTKIPPPYPFDRPPLHHDQTPVRPFLNGVPLPEQIVPITNNQNYRPNGFGNGIRPQSPPPWQQRPRPRPPNSNRRPNPNLPMYKPQPQDGHMSSYGNVESFTTIPHVEEPVLKTKPYNEHKDGNQNNDELNLTEIDETTTLESAEEENNETVNQNQISLLSDGESFVPARDPPTTSTTTEDASFKHNITGIKNDSEKAQDPPTKQEVLKDPEINNDKKKQTMIKIEKEKPGMTNKKQEEKIKDSEVQSIKNSSQANEDVAIKDINSNNAVFQTTPILESSMVETNKTNSIQSSTPKPISISSTPTDFLPDIKITKNVSTTSTSTLAPTSIINSQPSLRKYNSVQFQTTVIFQNVLTRNLNKVM